MPTLDLAESNAGASTLPYTVRPSMVVELMWAMWIHPLEPEPEFPARLDRFAGNVGLVERLRSFWSDGQCFFTELLVVADRAGALFEEDADRLWGLLEAAAAGADRPEPLGSEPPEDRERFLERLAKLRVDPALRDAWLALLRDTWEVIAPSWDSKGRMASEAQARELRQKLPDALGYGEINSMLQCDYDGTLSRVVRQIAAGGGVAVLVPAWFARKGMFVELPGVVVVTPPAAAQAKGPSDETRERARRFKALGDPTRLAILEAAGRRPRTVGELAELIGMAQPTVSNHVRVLRDAGLLLDGKDAPRRLEPDVPALQRLFKEAGGVVAGQP